MPVSADQPENTTAVSDEHRAWESAEDRHGAVIHQCPPEGSAVMPCCDRTPFEVPRWHRMTLDVSAVTCKGADGAHGPQSPPVTGPARTVEVSDRTGRTDPDVP